MIYSVYFGSLAMIQKDGVIVFKRTIGAKDIFSYLILDVTEEAKLCNFVQFNIMANKIS